MVFCSSRLSLLLLAVLLFVGGAFAEERPAPGFRTVEAVQSDWDATMPPAQGWVPVALPDDWSRRWPSFNGVVWYRLTFDLPDKMLPTAVLIDYWSLAGAAWLNGVKLDQDQSLVEPLSRAWNISRYLLLPPPLLLEKDNVLLLRISGLAQHQPGLGAVERGDAANLRERFARAQLLRHDLPLVSVSAALMLGGFFGVVWAMRRSEAAYGWYAVMSFAWALYSSNYLVTSPWPFPRSDDWARLTTIAFLATVAAFFMFSTRFAERRLPIAEAGLWIGFFLGASWMWWAPAGQLANTRLALSLAAVVVYLIACCIFLASTWRSRRIDYILLNLVNAIIFVGGVHDIILFAGVLNGTIYASPALSQFRLISMAFILAWHYVASLRRIERFNDELIGKVAAAREELALTLAQQHELALANTRLDERSNMAYNLHDGLGGTLVNNIALIQHQPAAINADRFLSILKELREELRAVVDISTGRQSTEQSLGEWLAPLRSRFTLLCESSGMTCQWDVDGFESCYLPPEHGLDWARILQESMTNALKHSKASCIRIGLSRQDGRLRLTIADNGHGFDVTQPSSGGSGLNSLRRRAGRIGATFDLVSSPGGTVLTFEIPYAGVRQGAVHG